MGLSKLRASNFDLDRKPIRFILKEQYRGFLMRGMVWLAIAILLIFAWIGSFVMYHVAGFLIHLLLIFAVISLLLSLFSGRRAKGGVVRRD
jgi:signal transduction histidine kinase